MERQMSEGNSQMAHTEKDNVDLHDGDASQMGLAKTYHYCPGCGTAGESGALNCTSCGASLLKMASESAHDEVSDAGAKAVSAAPRSSPPLDPVIQNLIRSATGDAEEEYLEWADFCLVNQAKRSHTLLLTNWRCLIVALGYDAHGRPISVDDGEWYAYGGATGLDVQTQPS